MVAYSYNYQRPVDYFLSFEVRNENTFEEIVFDLPDGLDEMDESIPLQLDGIDDLTLDKRKLSPDGYILEFLGNRGSSGLLGELFGMGIVMKAATS